MRPYLYARPLKDRIHSGGNCRLFGRDRQGGCARRAEGAISARGTYPRRQDFTAGFEPVDCTDLDGERRPLLDATAES